MAKVIRLVREEHLCETRYYNLQLTNDTMADIQETLQDACLEQLPKLTPHEVAACFSYSYTENEPEVLGKEFKWKADSFWAFKNGVEYQALPLRQVLEDVLNEYMWEVEPMVWDSDTTYVEDNAEIIDVAYLNDTAVPELEIIPKEDSEN